VKLAQALAHSGRGAEAAVHFENAAALLAPREALHLKRRAAEQLLRTGLFDRGVEASRGVLAAIGVRLPTTRSSTIFALVYYRVRLWMRGLRFRERDAGSIPVEELTRIDTCWSIGHAILCVDLFLGQVLVLRALLLALRAGDALRITRGMVAEVALSALPGMRTWRRTEALIRHAYDLAAQCRAPEVRWYPMTAEGAALLFGGRFRAAADVLAAALQLALEATTGLAWERALTRMMLVQSLALLGRFAELRRVQEEGLRDAIERGDLWGSVTMRIGDGNLAWLIADRPDAAEREARTALSDWSTRGFTIQHQEGLVAIAMAKLYAGDAEAAHALASDILRRMRLSFHWMVQVPRARARALRGCSALLVIARGGGRRGRLLRSVARDARALEREGVAWARAFAGMLRAGLALHLGSRAEAARGLELAATAFDACEMAAYAWAVRERAARLRGDAASAVEIARVEKALRAEGVVSPERFIAMLAPGFTVRDAPL